MPDPVYIVCGFPRSGTSMMMRAVDAGGIPAVYSPKRDAEVRAVGTAVSGYDPNPHGFYELDDLAGLDWAALRGRCVKVVRDNLDCLPRGERLRVAYLRRDPREIALSYPGTMSLPCRPLDLEFLAGYAAKVEADLAALRDLGADVTPLDYAQVVATPLAEFARLGWPLDLARAAATIDPALYRWRVA